MGGERGRGGERRERRMDEGRGREEWRKRERGARWGVEGDIGKRGEGMVTKLERGEGGEERLKEGEKKRGRGD